MGLETVVRPIVVTDFRPTPRRILPPSDDNAISIDGGSSHIVTLSHTQSASWSHTVETETHRTYDVMRIHNPDNDEQFVDDEVIKKIKFKGVDGKIRKVTYTDPPAQDNIEILEEDQERDHS